MRQHQGREAVGAACHGRGGPAVRSVPGERGLHGSCIPLGRGETRITYSGVLQPFTEAPLGVPKTPSDPALGLPCGDRQGLTLRLEIGGLLTCG